MNKRQIRRVFLFVVLAVFVSVAIYRIGFFIPLPSIDQAQLQQRADGNP